jgi:hypothetical protein
LSYYNRRSGLKEDILYPEVFCSVMSVVRREKREKTQYEENRSDEGKYYFRR